LFGGVVIFLAGVQETQVVMGQGVLRVAFQRPFVFVFCFKPMLLFVIKGTEVVSGAGVVGIEFQTVLVIMPLVVTAVLLVADGPQSQVSFGAKRILPKRFLVLLLGKVIHGLGQIKITEGANSLCIPRILTYVLLELFFFFAEGHIDLS